MSARTLLGIALAAVLGVVLFGSRGEDPYTIRLALKDAGGLENGSPVTVGGLAVGKVALEAERDRIDVGLRIDRKHAPIGRNATAAVVAQNLLGQKQVRLTLGDRRRDPAPDGFTLPVANVRPTTDLDQLLATLDPDTRTRLAIALNETGEALSGRRMDLSSALRDFAPAMRSGTRLLDQLTADNRALGQLVEASDRFIGALAVDRKGLGNALDRLGRTTETVATKRESLAATLRQAPAALRSARAFLAELRHTTAPLGTSARELTTSAPLLRTVMQRLPEFEQAAAPALATAVVTAPHLTRLGRRATPVIDRAAPVLAGLESMSKETLPGIGHTLDGSIDNLLAILENWSRAIQFSDGLSHIFRGEASFAPDLIESALKRLMRGSTKRGDDLTRRVAAPKGPANRTPEGPRQLPNATELPKKLLEILPKQTQAVPKELRGLLSGGSNDSGAPAALLDYLMGRGG